MDKTTLRIVSKIGLIIIMLGFCMPIACDLNGFQIADIGVNFSSEFDLKNSSGITPLSLALYGIFAFSCMGAILLLLVVMKKDISMGWDWFSIIGVIISAIVVIVRFLSGDFNIEILQYGACIIIFGLIIAMLFIFMATFKEDGIKRKEENTY